jgi:hypothetical protein
MKLQTTYRFEEDVKFLTYIIGFKCKVYTDLVLSTATEATGAKMLKGKDQEDAIKEIVTSVMNTLSDEYVKILLKYFSVDSLQEYIIELVLSHITSTITQLNNNQMKKFLRSALKSEDIIFAKKDLE